MNKISLAKTSTLALAIGMACILGAHANPFDPANRGDLYDHAINSLAQATTPSAKALALEHLEQALTEGDGRAAMRLASLALADIPMAGDLAYERAVRYYRQAADLDAPGAGSSLAVTLARRGYYQGKETPAGRETLLAAYELLTAETDRGQPTSDVLWNLGILETTGVAGPKDVVAGARHIEAAADAGHGMAALWTADRYSNSIPAEPEIEADYLQIAAAAGIRGAQDRLDVLTAGRRSPKSAPSLKDELAPPNLLAGDLIQVASLGNTPLPPVRPAPAAVTSVATGAASTASSTVISPTTRQDADQLAALRQQLDAQSREIEQLRQELARARADNSPQGLTTDQLVALNNEGLSAVLEGNYEHAIVKFREAAAGGYAPAQSNLGLMYLNGTSVPQDGRQAAKLFEQAANQGNVTSAENLGRIYEFGLGIHVDRSRAIQWYSRASELGSEIADSAIQRLKSR